MEAITRLELEREVLWDLENLQVIESLYSITGNPLLVWEAITVLSHLRALGQDGIKVPDLSPVPEWGLSYIVQSAIDMTRLANRDLDSGASPIVDRVPHILGFVLRNTNRFAEYRANRRCLDILTLFEESRAAGKTTAQAYEVIKQKHGHKSLSVIEGQVTLGKKLRERIIAQVNNTPTN